MRISALLGAFALLVALVVTPVATAAPASAAVTCSTQLTAFFDGTIRSGDPKEWGQHHFFVKVPISGFSDMTGLVYTGTARIYFKSERMNLTAWPGVGRNTWGVYTSWVISGHILDFGSNNWRIEWPQGANGIGCLLA